ncbi:MAG: transposase [Legionella sp.]|nr:transposase [Legionella sp.]
MQGRVIDKTNQDDFLLLDKLIPTKHFLRKINNLVDFSFVAGLAESCYCPNNGRPSIAPELYFRMLLIGYLYSIKSTRKLVDHISFFISYCEHLGAGLVFCFCLARGKRQALPPMISLNTNHKQIPCYLY